MPTDKERREVARRLRELEQGVIGALIPIGELAKNILRVIDYGRSGAMTPYGCIADLIDPGHDHFADATKMVDRDALLELADEMTIEKGDIWGWSRRIREALEV